MSIMALRLDASPLDFDAGFDVDAPPSDKPPHCHVVIRSVKALPCIVFD